MWCKPFLSCNRYRMGLGGGYWINDVTYEVINDPIYLFYLIVHQYLDKSKAPFFMMSFDHQSRNSIERCTQALFNICYFWPNWTSGNALGPRSFFKGMRNNACQTIREHEWRSSGKGRSSGARTSVISMLAIAVLVYSLLRRRRVFSSLDYSSSGACGGTSCVGSEV